ncbi:brefeldin A-inhibited guanine nucleotide-exchange protein 3 isoform X2 [Conger conger]|uniref:brefeldin A-inhibited guanine nucleotide-exchange protein 3 isoform X2 n=1 Tax=Conger conger TaxID=82655 RepID=UPI002A5A157D|nr:brefeldin A-inhibited guanine nucleotide-exchange protein 3 isoform X2 [Conger conger]
MEETLRKLQKDASGNKYKAIRDACTSARETLEAQNGSAKIQPSQLRERCLLPLRLALESKSTKLAQTALTGMQKMLCEDRFVTTETEAAEKQLLCQVLKAVRVTPTLHEDLQVEVMKVLLCITYTPTFQINGESILRIAEVCIETYMSSCHQRSINTAVRATLSQMLGDLTLQLRNRQENAALDAEDGAMATLHRKDISPTSEALSEDIVNVLIVFCEKLEGVASENQLLQLLYLECILSILSSCPPTMHLNRGFTDLIWKQLCPSLVAIMGNPMNDKTITSAWAHGAGSWPDAVSPSAGVSDQGRGSGCSSSAPALIGPVARTVCYAAAELVRLVGQVESMKPVLQSLYHRILLYPPPQHRVEAIRTMKEILGSPERLFDLAGPCVTEPESRKRSFSKRKSHLDLLKLVMDGMTEACMKGGIEACFSSVSCVCALLGALEELSQGRGLQPEQARTLLRRLDELKEGAESARESMEVNEADFRWQRHLLSSEHGPWDPLAADRSPDISISVTTDTGQTTLEGELGQTTPEECGEEPRLASPSSCGPDAPAERAPRPGAREGQPDVVQRSHALVYPDITNFLSVESRARPHGSRYSESNFSVDEQDLSRTEFDSCDQYSMAAEKDSGRSDVSDMGSDNCSLADEEQTPRDCPGHRSLRTAALSLKLMKNQEADKQSARLFVQSLAGLLPRLLGLPCCADVDVSLQNFSSTFCSGLQAGGIHSPGFEGSGNLSCQALMNADGLYLVSYYALLLNLKLCCSDYYRRKPAPVLVSLKEFVRQIQSSGVLVVLSQAWIEELYHQVLERNLLGEAGYWGTPEEHSLPLIIMLTDIDGLGSSAIGGQMIRQASAQSPFCCDKGASDTLMAGMVFARYILTGCWKNLIDTLSTPLTGRMAGSSKGLAFILGAEGVKEQNQRERDTICLSLDGLRKAAGLSCALGVAANCASALAQMAAASCVQEEKEEKEVETGDAIAQGTALTTHTAQTLTTYTAQTPTTHTAQTPSTHTAQTLTAHTAQTPSTHTAQTLTAHTAQTPSTHTAQTLTAHTAQTPTAHTAQTLTAQGTAQTPTAQSTAQTLTAPGTAQTLTAPGTAQTLTALVTAQTLTAHTAQTLTAHTAQTLTAQAASAGGAAVWCFSGGAAVWCFAVKQKVEQKLEQMGRPQGVRLHTAHMLCMDAILNVGLEMGSHNEDCWPHVFRVSEYVSSLEHTHFSDGGSQPPLAITQTQQAVDLGLELSGDSSPERDLGISHPVIQPLSIQELLKESGRGKAFDLRGGSLLGGAGAAKAVCTLSAQADRLFEESASKLNLVGLVGFLHQLRKASQSQLFDSVTETGDYSLAMPGEAKSTQDRRSALHLFRLGEAMLRIVRNKTRPLLHMMRAWSVVAPHLVEAACHKERHVSQKAVSFIHDVLTEVLTSWAELPHFHFNEALFRPFEHIMQLELCDEDVQDQVITSIGELVEMCSPQIQSGWRPLFSALRTVHGNKTDMKDYLVGEYSMGKSQAPVFDVFEAFISTDNIQVFANAATDYIMCLMKFVKGLEVDYKEIGDCVHGTGYSSTDLCLPALDYLRKCSQLLTKIYKMPCKPVFLGARLASLPMRAQERSVSSDDGMDSILGEFDDDTGLIQVWTLLLEQLTAAVSNCPRQHQPPTLELLFELLREVTKIPGPGFAIFSVIQLLLPVMSLWLQRSHGDHSYWDIAAANFKHAIGLSCELVVEHIHSFIHSDIGYESLINLMLKDLFKLLVAAVSEPAETISRVGCSCIRYVLVTAGPVFTEEMWRLACCALQDAFSTTLEPVKNLLACFHSGSDSFPGDACEVKVAAPSHSASAEAEYWRIRAMAQQVFMLDTQCSPKTPNNKDGFEHAQSCVLIIELPQDQQSNGHTQKRIPFRTIVVSLLSHQVLLQNLYDILLEEFVKSSGPPESQEKTTPVSEPKPTGFLRYISMQNLAIIFDLLLDSYRTARDFDTRPGLKYLLMKVSGVCGAANLYRQSAMSFNLYFQALLCAVLTNQESITAEQVKRILYEDEEGTSDSSQQCSSEDEDIFEETAQVSPPRGKEKRQWRTKIPSLSVQPVSSADWAWLVHRLHKLCMDLCNNYIQMHLDLESSLEEPPVLMRGDPLFFLPLFPSETSTPSTGGLSGKGTPSEDGFRVHLAETPSEEAPSPGPPGGRGGRDAGRKKEWWETAGNKLYTIATDKTKLMIEYKRRKQQHNLASFGKEAKAGEKRADPVTLRGPDSPLPQRPQQLVDQGPMRHSFSAGPEVLRQEKRPRSGSTASSHNISLRDSEAQIQAWTNMVLTILNQVQLLPDPTFVALLPAVFPCISQLTCHVTDVRVRQAVREWLGRVGRVYDIIL